VSGDTRAADFEIIHFWETCPPACEIVITIVYNDLLQGINHIRVIDLLNRNINNQHTIHIYNAL
jgi:hypothetical protein